MAIDGIRMENGVEVSFRTYGFASAAGGIGQRFYAKYYEAEDPNPRTIVNVFAKALASSPFALASFSCFSRAVCGSFESTSAPPHAARARSMHTSRMARDHAIVPRWPTTIAA